MMNRFLKKSSKTTAIVLVTMLLCHCITPPPRNVNHICHIFKQYPGWHREAKDVARRWKVPISVQMAIIHQESKFNALAEPPRRKLLGLVPWTRPSSALGYTQALTGTWALYRQKNGAFLASRSRFSDAVDFIGWYANLAHRHNGISRDDAYSLYLAYHEGTGGYQKKAYLKKPWLLHVAHKVATRAAIYKAQLARCKFS